MNAGACDRGFSIIELLISMALTLVVLTISVTSIQAMADASDGVGLMTDLNSNLRNAINQMTRDLLAAGRGIPVGGVPVPSGAAALPLRRPSALDNQTFPLRTTLPAVSAGDGLGPQIGDDLATLPLEGVATDSLAILVSDPTLALDASPLAALSADGRSVTVAATTPIDAQPDAVRAGDLILLTNARGSTLMMATGRTGQVIQFADTDPMQLNQLAAAAGTITSLQSAPGVYPPTTARRIQMVSYYIDNSNPARPALIRRVNMFTPRALAIGVENIQLSYDMVNGVDNPQNVPAPGEPNQIRKANVFVAGRSFRTWRRTREFLRTSVATQVSLRSLSFVDRYR